MWNLWLGEGLRERDWGVCARTQPSPGTVSEFVFRPFGAGPSPTLRRGLHAGAARRLNPSALVTFRISMRLFHRVLRPAFFLSPL